MGLKEKFLLSLNGGEIDEFDDDILTMQQMSEMMTDEARESVLSIIGEYETKQMNKFSKQLQIMSDACYLIKNTILPTLDGDLLKTIYNENEEEFTSVLDTIDEILDMVKSK